MHCETKKTCVTHFIGTKFITVVTKTKPHNISKVCRRVIGFLLKQYLTGLEFFNQSDMAINLSVLIIIFKITIRNTVELKSTTSWVVFYLSHLFFVHFSSLSFSRHLLFHFSALIGLLVTSLWFLRVLSIIHLKLTTCPFLLNLAYVTCVPYKSIHTLTYSQYLQAPILWADDKYYFYTLQIPQYT